MSLVLNFGVFAAHVQKRTTLDPQVDPYALRLFQETMSNVAAAVCWFASKPLVGDTSIITSMVRADIYATLGEASMSTEIVRALSVPLTIPLPVTMIGLIKDTTAVVHVNGNPKTLKVAHADTQLTTLIKGLIDAKRILEQYKGTVANSMAYELFFGSTDAEIDSAAKQLTDALGCSNLVLVKSAKKRAVKRPAAAIGGAIESTAQKARKKNRV